MRTKIANNLINSRGRRINQRLLVIESDDWGSIRMSSKDSFNELLIKGYPVNQCYFNSNDALESNNDLQYLFEVLNSVKGIDGKPAIFTANNVVGNPDFERIKENDFQQYFFEPFYKTLERYPHHDKVLDYYRSGIEMNLIKMQFHGREHVHVNNWLKALQKKDAPAMDAFNNGMFSVFVNLKSSSCYNEYLNAMATYSMADFDFVSNSIVEGMSIFESIWGYRSKSVIAPCYNWHSNLEKVFKSCGIEIIQSGRIQLSPSQIDNSNIPIKRFFGQKNNLGQSYFIRNCYFEPSTNLTLDWVGKVLDEVSTAFFWNKPAIISSHRLNYIGWLNSENRDRNLRLLKELLQKIVNKWPDVTFTSTDQLSKYFKS